MGLAEILDAINEAALRDDVVQALLLCQTLAGDAGSEGLRSWAEQELTGYSSTDDLPSYRWLKGAMVAHGAVPGGRIARQPIPPDLLPRDATDPDLLKTAVLSSIAEINAIAQKGESITLVPGHSARLARLVNLANAGSARYEQVHFVFPAAAYEGILVAVRSRLLSFTAELRRRMPGRTKLTSRKLARAVEDAATSMIVSIDGDNNTIAVSAGSGRVSARSNWWRRPGWVTVVSGVLGVTAGVLRGILGWPF